MRDEEVALKITHLYFEEIARLGLKRQLDLDQMINAYFYALKRLKGKEDAVKKIVLDLDNESKKETRVETKTVTTTATVPVVKETTTTVTTKTNADTVSDVIEK